MRKYSMYHVPMLSFFSKKLYIDAGLNWKGVNFLYLLLLLAICLITPMIRVHIGTADFIKNEAPAFVDQIPEITVSDGKVSIKEEQPYYITAPDSEKVLGIIDTTGQIESLEGTEAFCLLTENALITKHSDVESRTYDLSTVKETFVLDSERINGWLQIASKFAVAVLYPFALAGSYIYRIIQVLIYAAIGLLFAAICKVTLSYAALIRLAVIAVTPCIIAGTIFGIAEIRIPGFIYLIAALGYLFFAVRSIAVEQQVSDEVEILRAEPEE